MAVICFIDGGSAAVSHCAARQMLLSSGRAAGEVGYLDSNRPLEFAEGSRQGRLVDAALSSRELISAITRLDTLHKHVVVDVSWVPDHTAAVALSLSDFALIPLCLDHCDLRAFADAVDLVRIVTTNMRRSLKHSVYLASRSNTVPADTKVQVSSLLAQKGLSMIPAPLCGWVADQTGMPSSKDGTSSRSHAVFAHSVFDMVNRDFTPAKRWRRFGYRSTPRL